MPTFDEAIKKTKELFREGSEDKKKHEEEFIDLYRKRFSYENLEDFEEFFEFDINRHWDRVDQNKPMVLKRFDQFKKAIKYILNERVPIEKRIEEVLESDGKFNAKNASWVFYIPFFL